MFRKHALLCALAFVCTLASSAKPVWAGDEEDARLELYAATFAAQSAPSGDVQSMPLSVDPIEPAQYNGDVRDLPRLELPDYYHNWNELEGPPSRKPLL